jgi:murein DD-endopeptidase MepM/ murein hydrolase activator NlpD
MRRVLLLTLLIAACDRAPLGELFEPGTPHEEYARALRDAGLERTALGSDWLSASERALTAPVDAALPFRETGFFPADEATAAGYRLTLRRGQRLVASMQLEGQLPARIFLDLYRAPADSLEQLERVESADSLAPLLEHEARRDGLYILRVQPELLRAVKYALELRIGQSLAFPIAERDERAVRSFFGAERDGGRREHHGIDIFAPRGTPVLAAANGYIRNVGSTRLGGNVVWLYDEERRQSLYYAHLDTQLVERGMRVRLGDTLGLVGNSGNARTTAPHLHFGIYARGSGPIDPFPFVSTPRGTAPALAADTAALGSWVRSTAEVLPVRRSLSADTVARVPRSTVMRVLGAASDAYRVRLPDGSVGYVSARSTAPGARPGGE